jgi:Flp pilus assembly protein TadB
VTALITFALGAGIGIGVFLTALGVVGRPVFRPVDRRRPTPLSPRALALVTGALGAGLAMYALTGWLAGALLVVTGTIAAPRFWAGRADHQREVARVEAIAAWAEMLRDTIAGAAALEQAIAATGPLAPAPIAEPVARLAMRLDIEPLPVALRRFADDVDHPTCDFVVAALVIAAEKEARDLGPLLGQLATCARDEAKMRTRIWIDRAKTRTSVKVIAGCVLLFAAGLLVFSRSYLEPYDTAVGQVVLLVIGAIFAASLVAMDRMARIELPERFVARRPA